VADILKFLNHIHGDLRKLSINLEVLSLEQCDRPESDDYCLIAQLKNLSELNLSVFKVDYMYVQPYI